MGTQMVLNQVYIFFKAKSITKNCLYSTDEFENFVEIK